MVMAPNRMHLWWAPRWERIRLEGKMDAKYYTGEPGAMPYDRDWEPEPDEDRTCQRCGGDGGFHDCGEDTCCCDPASSGDLEDPDWVVCPSCGGTGVE